MKSNVPKRFIVKTCERASDDRKFANGECIFNQRLGRAYSAEETVDALNNVGAFGDFVRDLIQVKIWYYQGKFKETGDEKYLTSEKCLKELRDDFIDDESCDKYMAYLEDFVKKEGENNGGR